MWGRVLRGSSNRQPRPDESAAFDRLKLISLLETCSGSDGDADLVILGLFQLLTELNEGRLLFCPT